MHKGLNHMPYRKIIIIAAIAAISVSIAVLTAQRVFSRPTPEVNYGPQVIEGPVLLVNRIHDYTNSDFKQMSLQDLSQYPTLVAALKQADANFEAAERPCFPGDPCSSPSYWGPPPASSYYRIGIPAEEVAGVITSLNMRSLTGQESQGNLSSPHASHITIDGKFYAVMISPS